MKKIVLTSITTFIATLVICAITSKLIWNKYSYEKDKQCRDKVGMYLNASYVLSTDINDSFERDFKSLVFMYYVLGKDSTMVSESVCSFSNKHNYDYVNSFCYLKDRTKELERIRNK